jgi:hypothetical protein
MDILLLNAHAVRQQPTGIQKSTEQNAHYLLTIRPSSFM